jgi:HJR/Mrr/RecB family endonuclease
MRSALLLACAFAAALLVTFGWRPVDLVVLSGLAVALGAVVIAMAGWLHRRQRMRTLQGLAALDPTAFEQQVAGWLRRDGWRVEHRGGPNDEGIDVIATGRKVLLAVQCKRYQPDSSIGPAVVRELYGAARGADADAALLVTTARISSAAARWAESLASDRPHVLLIDGEATVAFARGRRRIRPRDIPDSDSRRRPDPVCSV